MGGNLKFQVQDSDLEYLFWRFEKQISLSDKKPPLGSNRMLLTAWKHPGRNREKRLFTVFQRFLRFSGYSF